MEEIKLNTLITKYDFVVNSMKSLPVIKQTSETFVKLLQKYGTFKNKVVHKSSVRLVIDEIEYKISIPNVTEEIETECRIQDIAENLVIYDELEQEDSNDVNSWNFQLSESVVRAIIVKHFISEF